MITFFCVEILDVKTNPIRFILPLDFAGTQLLHNRDLSTIGIAVIENKALKATLILSLNISYNKPNNMAFSYLNSVCKLQF